jgi:AraC-like DNA-binding protein
MKSLAALRSAARRLPIEPYIVDRPVDERGQYQLELAKDFPFAIKRLRFHADQPKPPLTWHTYLELFVLLSPACRLQMGGTNLSLRSGDVLVMDHLKLHAVREFSGETAEAIVIRFHPEIVRGTQTAESDHLLLLPFYCQVEERPHVLRAKEAGAAPVHAMLAQLFEACATADRYWQTGARAFFLVTLHHLARHFRAAEQLSELHARQRIKGTRLREVFEFLGSHFAERISLPQVATMAGLSRPQFHAVFKRAAGMTLIDYITQLRLTHASRLLCETDQSVAEIASAVGFADQSYFDRRFRRFFGRTPRDFRRAEVDGDLRAPSVS